MASQIEEKEFLSRPAIQWNGKTLGCGYWDADFLVELFQSNQNKDHDSIIASLSYRNVLLVATYIVRNLRQKLQEVVATPDVDFSSNLPTTKGLVAISVAVAIPEGPFLPLAILVAHALNVPFQIPGSQAAVEGYVVLIPIEPNEGKQRIRHMLSETRPCLTLCLAPDVERLTEIVGSLDDNDAGLQDVCSGTMIFRAKHPRVLNFADVAREAAAEIEALGSQTIGNFDNCFRKMESLQSGVSRCCQVIDPKDTIIVVSTNKNRISHCAYTSGSTGIPKGSFSSIQALRCYMQGKNYVHSITCQSVVLLASALSFDPCLSDILATFEAKATLGLAPRNDLSQNLFNVLRSLRISHVLCTPTLWSTMQSSGPNDFPVLRVIALGGEPIPKHIVRKWGRRSKQDESNHNTTCRLFATYGVTEACVYQTMGEVTADSIRSRQGQEVGLAFPGMHYRICDENNQEKLVDVGSNNSGVGEIVLHGSQLDKYSTYLCRPELNRIKFKRDVTESSWCDSGGTKQCRVYYRTGDRGYTDSDTGSLCIVGRIGGEEGMLKINGVRVELGEIEAALVDDVYSDRQDQEQHQSVIVNAAVVAMHKESSDNATEIVAYCVLSSQCANEMGIKSLFEASNGILCSSKPMLTLLRSRCKENVRVGCTPSAFIFVPNIPISPTGKRQLVALPPVEECTMQESVEKGTPLQTYGHTGRFLGDEIASTLNLQQCQMPMLTTSVSFSMLGGDSLAAVRIVRALYARHHGLQDSRYLGGDYGTLDGAFSAVNLVTSPSLGAYVDFLDRNGIRVSSNDNKGGGTCQSEVSAKHVTTIQAESSGDNRNTAGVTSTESQLYEALIMATSQGHSSLAIALLQAGADPNGGAHSGRLGKIGDRRKRKKVFRSGPMHIASLKGDADLVRELLRAKAKFNLPDANGLFPLHLAATGENPSQKRQATDEDKRRLDCVKSLLQAGSPLYMKDGNRQSLIHCAARAGNYALLEYILPIWKAGRGEKDFRGSSLDWRDHWGRTGVHWAILNGHLDTLKLLLRHGCSPEPAAFKENTKRSSIALESPLQLCERLYGTTESVGLEIASVLMARIDN